MPDFRGSDRGTLGALRGLGGRAGNVSDRRKLRIQSSFWRRRGRGGVSVDVFNSTSLSPEP